MKDPSSKKQSIQKEGCDPYGELWGSINKTSNGMQGKEIVLTPGDLVILKTIKYHEKSAAS